MELCLSESLINCASSDVQHFVLWPTEMRGESLVWQIYASRYETVVWKNRDVSLCNDQLINQANDTGDS